MNLAEWILVTEQDMLDEFKKTSIELGGVPADATFLLGDAHVKAGDYTFNQGKQ